MRTYSTPQSALNGEITKLAIIECVASAAVYVGLGVYLGTFKYLAVAVVFAPLMLFRTEISADWGLRTYRQAVKRISAWADSFEKEWQQMMAAILGLMLEPVVGTAIRFIATLYWTFRRPLQALRDTPRNWIRQAFCTDFAHPPEIVPKEAMEPADTNIIIFADYWKSLQRAAENRGDFGQVVLFIITLPFLIVGFIPSILYRVSFKATALAYIPFVWVAHATLRNPLPAKARLERFTKGELEKVRRGVSYLVLTTLVAKGALVLNWVDRARVEGMFPSQKIVTNFVVLDAWPWWQITFGADALLTFALLFFADAALSRIEAQRPWREESVMTTMATISFLRASFGIVTIAHFFHIALVTASPEWARHLLTF